MVRTRSRDIGLLSMPPEVFDIIASHLYPSSSSSPAVIQPLLRTNKALYERLLPLSVHAFRNDENQPHDGKVKSKPNLPFFRYITQTKPMLAPHVRRLVFGDFQTTSEADDEPRVPNTLVAWEKQALQELFERTLSSLPTAERKTKSKEWLKAVANGVEDAEVSLLLVACPYVEEIYIGDPYEPTFFRQVIHAVADTTSQAPSAAGPLRKLRSVSIESQENKYGYLRFTETAAPFFRLPSVRSFECVMPSDGDPKDFKNIPPRSSSIEHLSFRSGCISEPVMQVMVGLCAGLRSFEYSHGIYHMYDGQFSPRELREALLPHSHTLEDLILRFEDDWQINWEELPLQDVQLGVDFRNMVALKSLVVGMQLVSGLLAGEPMYSSGDDRISYNNTHTMLECLPPNLEFLEVNCCGADFLEQAQELLTELASPRNRFPKLKHVRFLFVEKAIEPEQINLSCASDSVHVEVVSQTSEQREYDRMGGTKLNDGTDGSRDKWLETRGSGTQIAVVRPKPDTSLR